MSLKARDNVPFTLLRRGRGLLRSAQASCPCAMMMHVAYAPAASPTDAEPLRMLCTPTKCELACAPLIGAKRQRHCCYGSAEVNRDETRPPLSLKQIYGIPVMHITAVQLQHGQKCNKFSMLVKIQTARLNISTNEWTSLCAPLKQRSRTVKAYKKVFDCFVKFRPSV